MLRWIVVFKVKVTVKVQDVIESMSVLYSLYTDCSAAKLGVLVYYY